MLLLLWIRLFDSLDRLDGLFTFLVLSLALCIIFLPSKLFISLSTGFSHPVGGKTDEPEVANNQFDRRRCVTYVDFSIAWLM